MPLKIGSAYPFIFILFFLVLAFPQPLFLEPLAAQESQSPAEQSEAVFTSVCNSFALLASLLNDVRYIDNSGYPVLMNFNTHEAAIRFLSQGFQADLATAMVNYYLAWDEELGKMVVIPTDSIPLINSTDRENTSIVFINADNAVLQCRYNQCYAENDRYLYTVHVQKEASRWKINDLSLEEMNSGDRY